LLLQVLLEQTDGTSGSSDSDFAHCMTATCLRLLEDPEVRVRLAVGHAMAALAQQEGLPAYQQCRQPLLDSIYHNFVSGSPTSSGCSTPEPHLLAAATSSSYSSRPSDLTPGQHCNGPVSNKQYAGTVRRPTEHGTHLHDVCSLLMMLDLSRRHQHTL
jgi:hypothetical protein